MIRLLPLIVCVSTAAAAVAAATAAEPQQTPPAVSLAPAALPPAPELAMQKPGEPQVTPQPPKPGPTPPPTQEAPRRPRGRDVNIQIELTISDQMGSAAPDKKVVSMITADATMGRVRANADARRGDMGIVPTGLNVDARPTLIDADKILLELTVEYTPLRETQVAQRPTILNESISVILMNGKPLMISQAADPITDRKMTVEVKATIVR